MPVKTRASEKQLLEKATLDRAAQYHVSRSTWPLVNVGALQSAPVTLLGKSRNRHKWWAYLLTLLSPPPNFRSPLQMQSLDHQTSTQDWWHTLDLAPRVPILREKHAFQSPQPSLCTDGSHREWKSFSLTEQKPMCNPWEEPDWSTFFIRVR